MVPDKITLFMVRWSKKWFKDEGIKSYSLDCGELLVLLFLYFQNENANGSLTDKHYQTLEHHLIPSLRLLIPGGLCSDTWALRLGSFWM